MSSRVLCLFPLLCAAACGAHSTPQRAPVQPASSAPESCAAVPDPRAQSQASALAAATNVLDYEAAWRSAHPDSVAGGIGAAEVRTVAHAHTADLSACYEAALAKVDQASGRVVVRFVIDPQGHVGAAHLALDELHVEGVGCCVVQRVAAWTFPSPEGGGYAVVEYPFTVRLHH